MQMNIAEAKAKLSELVAAAERGEEVLIARGGKPVVRLLSANATSPAFRIGIAEGAVSSIPDFLEPMSEEEISLWN
ncbi:type II toxin-antitoxin system prevent-host-death family antitoxin [Tropicimonas sp. TH_r6]|uniref:type II toxin-antitoxin system Phd/YefM family antitoxin n=1 Tax=Tropicimonas sp. TH_r6 TaxID=3082085 RepID=UPI0029546559|nr:type II toxin-antitoxin system prevent-host-death family antitoxin [Tropicimonas sp. TH_r6]MDV7142999.1 type II toxin-antitoxin system prevent-host-death family antitoxin [Tropicimonas sp. TH_r6]